MRKTRYLRRLIVPLIVLMISILHSCRKEERGKCCECMERGEILSDAYIADTSIDLRGIPYLEKTKLLQIPDRTLAKMCPFGLVESCLNYRLIYLPFAYNNVKEGIEQMHHDFNGMKELIVKTDAQKPFVIIYGRMDPSNYDANGSDLEKGRFSRKFTDIEILMAYDPIRDKFTRNEKILLLENAVRIYEAKKQESIFGGGSLVMSIFLIANMLSTEGFAEFDTFLRDHPYIAGFINGYLNDLQYVSDGDEIANLAQSFVNQNK